MQSEICDNFLTFLKQVRKKFARNANFCLHATKHGKCNNEVGLLKTAGTAINTGTLLRRDR